MQEKNSRRRFIKSSLLSLGGIYLTANFISCSNDDELPQRPTFPKTKPSGFHQGVASFDPTDRQIIIWTRYSEGTKPVEITWQFSYDAQFKEIVREGKVLTDSSRDYTVSVEVQDLKPGKKYYYRFAQEEAGKHSVIGETLTLPTDPTQLKLAVCSCANYPAGLFNVYGAMAASDADIVLHLGDYIYEYGRGEYGTNSYTSTNDREHKPSHEIITLEDYRTRYKQYRKDENLQLLHQKKPFICVWDDHEIANDSYKEGAENHQENEGSWHARKQNAIQAYSEYLPMMTNDTKRIYRDFTYGNLVHLIMLDSRVIGRDKQLSYGDYFTPTGFNSAAFQQDWLNPARTILGTTQRDWLVEKVTTNSAKWQVIGQQVLMAKIFVPTEMLLLISKIQAEAEANGSASPETFLALQKSLQELVEIKLRMQAGDPTLTSEEMARVTTVLPYNLDAWDGYPAEREYLFAAFGNKKVISLAGDTHNAWLSSLKGLQSSNETGKEFATSSVSSPGLEKYLGANQASIASFEQAMQILVDDMSFLNASERGYMMVTFTQAASHSEWIFVDTVFSSEYMTQSKHTHSYSG